MYRLTRTSHHRTTRSAGARCTWYLWCVHRRMLSATSILSQPTKRTNTMFRSGFWMRAQRSSQQYCDSARARKEKNSKNCVENDFLVYFSSYFFFVFFSISILERRMYDAQCTWALHLASSCSSWVPLFRGTLSILFRFIFDFFLLFLLEKPFHYYIRFHGTKPFPTIRVLHFIRFHSIRARKRQFERIAARAVCTIAHICFFLLVRYRSRSRRTAALAPNVHLPTHMVHKQNDWHPDCASAFCYFVHFWFLLHISHRSPSLLCSSFGPRIHSRDAVFGASSIAVIWNGMKRTWKNTKENFVCTNISTVLSVSFSLAYYLPFAVESRERERDEKSK